MKIPRFCSHGSVSRLSRRAIADSAATFLFRFILSFSALALVLPLRGQVGNDNPTGPSGIFNGNITTGCSYDSYTGNAMRTVTDITVAGAVGTYGLSLSRISNSRTPSLLNGFGEGGGWRHSYQWSVDASGDSLSTASPTCCGVHL